MNTHVPMQWASVQWAPPKTPIICWEASPAYFHMDRAVSKYKGNSLCLMMRMPDGVCAMQIDDSSTICTLFFKCLVFYKKGKCVLQLFYKFQRIHFSTTKALFETSNQPILQQQAWRNRLGGHTATLSRF
jgi:hypothetical protein